MTKLRRYLVLIAILLAVLLAAAFAWLNPQSITLDLGFGVVETPVAYAVIACLAVGWILGLLSALGRVVRTAAQGRKDRKAAQRAEAARQRAARQQRITTRAELLLADVLGMGRVDLYLQFERILTSAQVDAYRQCVKERLQGKPVLDGSLVEDVVHPVLGMQRGQRLHHQPLLRRRRRGDRPLRPGDRLPRQLRRRAPRRGRALPVPRP